MNPFYKFHTGVCLTLLLSLPAAVQATGFPGYLSGKATIGGNSTAVHGNLILGDNGELFLGTNTPGLKTNTLNLTGNYTGVEGSRVYHSIVNNSNTSGTRGYIAISGTATQSEGGTSIHYLESWMGQHKR